jgi:hypothetical protein
MAQPEPDAATLAQLKQQCKTWGWDFDETLAEWKSQQIIVQPTSVPKPVKRLRDDDGDLSFSLDNDIGIMKCTMSDAIDLYQQSTKPASFADATKWEHVELRGWNQTLVHNLASDIHQKYKKKLIKSPIGFIGDTATGKTLFCELFCVEYKFTIIKIQETDPDELKEWLDLAVNPSLLDTSDRLWVCEHWDAYMDTKCGTILKKYFKKMLQTGIIICTAWTGFDTRVQTSGIEVWYKFLILNKSEALQKGAKRIHIDLSKQDTIRLLEYAGGDLSAAISTLQYFRGPPPITLDIAKSMPPPNLRVLINNSLIDRSQHMMRLLGEADDLALTYLFHEIVPEAQCLAAKCLSVDTRGNHDHDMWMCAGNLEKTWRAYDAVSFTDAAAGYDGKIFKQIITGPLHSVLDTIDTRTLTPLQIPTPQIIWKQNQPNIKERQKKVTEFFGYGIPKDHLLSVFTRGREKKEEEDMLDIYSIKVSDGKALPGASILLWSRPISDPRQAPDLRDRTLDLMGTWTETKYKTRINGKWLEKLLWD